MRWGGNKNSGSLKENEKRNKSSGQGLCFNTEERKREGRNRGEWFEVEIAGNRYLENGEGERMPKEGKTKVFKAMKIVACL